MKKTSINILSILFLMSMGYAASTTTNNTQELGNALAGGLSMKGISADDILAGGSRGSNVSKKSAITLKAPEYLSVPEFDKCLGKEAVQDAILWCLPKEKFNNCPQSSWEQLQNTGMASCTME